MQAQVRVSPRRWITWNVPKHTEESGLYLKGHGLGWVGPDTASGQLSEHVRSARDKREFLELVIAFTRSMAIRFQSKPQSVSSHFWKLFLGPHGRSFRPDSLTCTRIQFCSVGGI